MIMDKKTSKQIDNIVSDIRLSIYKSALNITEGIQREIEERLVQSIQNRWEYIDKQKNHDTNRQLGNPNGDLHSVNDT